MYHINVWEVNYFDVIFELHITAIWFQPSQPSGLSIYLPTVEPTERKYQYKLHAPFN